MLCGCMCRAHARPCLSTGWVLNRCFHLTFGAAAVLAQGEAAGYFVPLAVCLAFQWLCLGARLFLPPIETARRKPSQEQPGNTGCIRVQMEAWILTAADDSLTVVGV